MSLNEAKMPSLADKLNASQPEETVVAPQIEEVDQKKASKKKETVVAPQIEEVDQKKASKKKKDKIDK